MATPYHLLGTAIIVPTGGLTLAWTATITDGTTTTTLTSADAADPVLTAGTYDPVRFMQHCANKIRASLFARLVADAWVVSEPSAATDLIVEVGVANTLTPGVGTNPLVITVSLDGSCSGPAGVATISVFTLVNTSNNWCWLGLAYPGESRSLTVSGGRVSEVSGRFQPRWLFCFRSTFRDTGDQPQSLMHVADILDDNTVSQYDFGAGPTWHRDLTLVDLPQHLAGPPWVVGKFSAFGATRELLALAADDSTLLANISGSHKATTNLATPAYVYSGKWWARYRDESVTDTYRCFDVWPSTRTPVAGEPIQVISEADALIKEVRRVGLLFVFEVSASTGTSLWISKAYALRTGANPVPIRRASGNLYWSLEIPLVLVPNPDLATP